MAPIYAAALAKDEAFAKTGSRLSDDTAFEVTIEQYIELVEFTGRQIRAGKKGVIPQDLAPIYERLGIEQSEWVDGVNEFERWACRVVGTPAQMEQAAAAAGRNFYHDITRCRSLFIEAPPPDE